MTENITSAGSAENVSQTSASDRYEAARKALTDLRTAIDGPHPADSGLDSFTLAHVSHALDANEAALRALITPPGVGETDEAIAELVAHGYLDEHGMPAVMQLAALAGHIERIALACVRAGIQSAHETWEPEVAMQPSQEQMLRWLGLEYRWGYGKSDTGGDKLHIYAQDIEKEEI